MSKEDITIYKYTENRILALRKLAERKQMELIQLQGQILELEILQTNMRPETIPEAEQPTKEKKKAKKTQK